MQNMQQYTVNAQVFEAATTVVGQLPADKVGKLHLAMLQIIQENKSKSTEKKRATQEKVKNTIESLKKSNGK